MNVLVTGGAGFIGSHVVERLLARGDSVSIVDNFDDFYDPAMKRANIAAFARGAALHDVDIRDVRRLREAVTSARPEAIIHLAARAGVRPSIQQPLLYTEVNVAGTQHLLELVREFRIPKFVFASSSSVYGVNQKIPFAESDPIFHPISPYAATKLAGEALCHVYHHLFQVDVVCLRFFTVYGPRQRPDLAIRRFATAILSGQPIELYGDGSTRRDYTYIDDIVQGVLAALDRPLGYEVINLGESQTISLVELVRHIESATGRSARVRWLPAQDGDVPVTLADISKAQRLLDYRPQVPLTIGIPKFIEWLRRNT